MPDSTTITLVLGTPVVVSSTTPVGINFTVVARVRTTINKLWSLKCNILVNVSNPGSRFYGDPGVGKVIIGSTSGTQTNTDFAGIVTDVGGSGLWVNRIYPGQATITPGSSAGNKIKAQIDFAISQGHTVSLDFLHTAYSAVGTWSAGGAGALQGLSDYKHWIDYVYPKPAFICIYHEPEDNFTTAAAATGYRADKRYIAAYLKANCPNFVHTDSAFKDDYVFKTSTNVDWRWWSVDWRGTTTSPYLGKTSGPYNPNPADFYLGNQKLADIVGLDIYNWWGGSDPNKNQSYTEFYQHFDPGFLLIDQAYGNDPKVCYCILELGAVTYCGDYTHAVEDFGAANHAKNLQWWSDAMDHMVANKVVMPLWWNVGGDAFHSHDTPGWHAEAMKLWIARSTSVSFRSAP